MENGRTGFQFFWWEFDWASSLAFLIATATVLLLIYGRHEIRIRRLAALRDYANVYPLTAQLDTIVGSDSNDYDPSFEYAKAKYSSDLGYSANDSDDRSETAKINAWIRHARFFSSGTGRLVMAGLGYWAVVYAGFLIAFGAASCSNPSAGCHPLANLLTTGGLLGTAAGDQSQAIWQSSANSLTVASFAFIGAYAASLRYMLRALSTFDFSSFTFIRQAAMIALTTVLVMCMYRAAPNIDLDFTRQAAQVTATQPDTSMNVLWLALALSLGLLPGSIFQFILARTRDYFTWMKSTDDRFLEWTRIVPLDVIDGIDYFTRFRLEECGISDVQALATYNPIMLHIETPYKIFQALDWITQAQLCCVVGLDRFLLLRQFNIRTIFDLERALKEDKTTDKKRTAAMDTFDHIYAGILFSPNSAMRGVEDISKVRLLMPDGAGMKEVTASEYSSWARNEINKPDMLSHAIEHLMSWISDDLHVRRARRIWNEISVQLGPGSLALYGDKTITGKARSAAGDASSKPKAG